MRSRPAPRRSFSGYADVVERADALSRYAAQLEAEIAMPFGEPVGVIREDYNANFGELVVCDPTAGAFTVYLPTIRPQDVGGAITFKNNSTSTNAITLQPRGDSTFDRAAFGAIAVANLPVVIVAISPGEWVSVSLL